MKNNNFVLKLRSPDDKDNQFNMIKEEFDKLGKEIEALKEENKNIKEENKKIIEFNRTLLSNKPSKPDNKNVDVKDKLAKYLSEE